MEKVNQGRCLVVQAGSFPFLVTMDVAAHYQRPFERRGRRALTGIGDHTMTAGWQEPLAGKDRADDSQIDAPADRD